MPYRSIVWLVVPLALLASFCASPDAARERPLPTGPYELPEFTPADFQAALGDLRGVPVLVNIWGSWCGPCRDEAPLLASAHERYGDRVRFLGVDILDQRASARAFIREYGWTYPSVFDPGAAIRDGLGILGQPATLFFDAEGALVSRWLGPIPRDVLIEGLESILPR